MSTQPPKGPSRADLRRARREAERRQQAWGALRSGQDSGADANGQPAPYPPLLGTGPQGPEANQAPFPGAAADALHPSAYAALPLTDGEAFPVERAEATGLQGPWAQALFPVLTALSVVVTAVVGLPVLGQPLRPLPAVLGFAFSAGAAFLWRDAWKATPHWRARAAGGFVAALLLGSFLVGLTSQVVVDGRPQLTGSTQEQTFRTAERILNDTKVLSENQKLLRLSAEQASTLLPLFDEGIAQDAAIAARWNPATAAELPTPALTEAYRRLNAAAGLQAAALQSQKQNLLSPDQKLAADAAEKYQQVAALVGDGPGSVSEAVRAALKEVGLAGTGGTQAPSIPTAAPSGGPSVGAPASGSAVPTASNGARAGDAS